MSCALRVNTATILPQSPAGGGQQNGAGDASPLRLLLRGAARVSSVVWSLRGVVVMRGQLRSPHTPGLVRSWLRHHRAALWGAVSR
jgi:hypothetical protein